MKMRDELELYKGKAADAELHILNLNVEHDDNVKAVHEKYQQEYAQLQAESEKKFKDKDDQYQRRQADVTRLQEQINNLQDILDVIPGVMTRTKTEGCGAENACHVRLASVLAQKFM